MKITCISTARVPSNTANSIQVMKVCDALTRLGHAVTLFVPGSQAAPWEDFAAQYGLSTHFLIRWLPANPRWKRNDFAWNAARHAKANGAEVVYTWTGQSAVFALLQRIPTIFEVHDLPTGRLGPLWFRALLRLPGKKRLAVITNALRTRIEQRFGGIPDERVVIAPNGVDLEAYTDLPDAPLARSTLGWKEATTVLCSGHLYAGRGTDLFLALAKRFPHVMFVWVGGRAEEVTTYRQQAAGLENVTFTGFVPQSRLPLYQAAADVLFMPYARSVAGSSGGNSADICSPMKMFDYLAAGRAILSSDLPVIREVLNTRNACFAQPEDVTSWAEALGGLIADKGLRDRLGRQARLDAAHYTWRLRTERVLAGWR